MNKAAWVVVYILFASVLFTPLVAHAGEADIKNNQERKSDSLIVFEGKLYCLLKRPVSMPFPGVFKEVNIRTGQSVRIGDIVAQYDMDEGKALQLGREIFFQESADLLRHIEEEKLKLDDLQRNQRELRQVTGEKLSPKHVLQRLQKRIELEKKYIAYLDARYSEVKNFESRKLEYIRNTVGDSSLEPGQIPGVVKLKAPVSGVVLSLHPQLRRHSYLPQGTIVALIGKMDTMLIRSLVYERDVVHLSVGTQVRFFPDALPAGSFPARITSINWVLSRPESDSPSYYQVEMTIDNKALELRPGFKGRVECQLGTQK